MELYGSLRNSARCVFAPRVLLVQTCIRNLLTQDGCDQDLLVSGRQNVCRVVWEIGAACAGGIWWCDVVIGGAW